MPRSPSPGARTPVRRASLLFLLLATASCFAPGSEVGELGEAGFSYVCEGASDAACDVTQPRGLPDVALGSEFGVSLSSEYAARPMSPTPFLDEVTNTVESTTFRARIAGFAVLLASDRYDEAGDLVHVHILQPDSVHLQRDAQSGFVDFDVASGLDLTVGESLSLRAVPFGADAQPLAGALPTSWSVEDDAIVSLDGPTGDNVLPVRALAEGTTQVRVTQGDLAVSVAITVVGGAR